jgi:adenosine deaminase/aminodeoxyfutalosine deaminase
MKPEKQVDGRRSSVVGEKHTPSKYILSLPKAELHLHLEGSVDAATLSELSRRHNKPIPPENNSYGESPDSGRVLSEQDVRRLYQYRDFNGFMMAFKAVTERLRTPEDYELITYRLMQRLASENVLHAEVYLSVGVVLWRGFDFDPLFEGLERGRQRGEREFGTSLFWIFDAVRHFGAEAAERVVDKAIRFRERNVVGIGIGGDERRGPAEWFRDSFDRARKHGLRLTAHAGETTGPESIVASLDVLGAERIGHGLSAVQDPGLMRRMAEQNIPVEICLSSNVRTGCCASIEQHPLKKYVDAGMMVTLNTDDPAMFGTSLAREYQLAQDVFGFTDDQLREFARNSFRASFLTEERKRGFLSRL